MEEYIPQGYFNSWKEDMDMMILNERRGRMLQSFAYMYTVNVYVQADREVHIQRKHSPEGHQAITMPFLLSQGDRGNYSVEVH